MKSSRIIATVVIGLFFALCAGVVMAQTAPQGNPAGAGSPNAPKADYSQLAVALEQSGLSYQKVEADLWSVTIKTSDKADDKGIKFFLKGNGDIVSILLVLSQSPKKLPDALKEKFADLNNKYYFVKFVYDDANIYLRIDSLVGAINGPILSNYISRLLKTVDSEAAGIMEVAGVSQSPAPDKEKGK